VKVTLVVFAKAPEPGRVKTRLIPALGAQGAADLAGALLRDTLNELQGLPDVDLLLATCGDRAVLGQSLENDPRAGIPRMDQGGGDLGQRLERCLSAALEHADAVFAVGADAPGLSQARVTLALEFLARHDAVLGPAEDGGFYLLGLRRVPPGVLADLPWGTRDTCRATRARLEGLAFEVQSLPALFDVDRPEDLVQLEALLEAEPERLSCTRAVLCRS